MSGSKLKHFDNQSFSKLLADIVLNKDFENDMECLAQMLF